MAFDAIWNIIGALGSLIEFAGKFLSQWGLFLLRRAIFCLILMSLLFITENQVVIMDAAGQVSNAVSNIIPDFSFINDIFNCIDGVRSVWNVIVDVFQSFFFIISAAIGKPITSFTREAHFVNYASFNPLYNLNEPELMSARAKRDVIITPRGLADFCSYFIPMRDFMIDVINIIFGGLRDFLNEVFVVFPNFPNLRSRVVRNTWRVVDASGALFDKRFSVIDALKVFVEAIMDAFVDIFDPHFCFHPIDEFPATLWGCLGCGFNRTQAAATTLTKINAPIVCVCGGTLNDNTVILVINCIGLGPLLSIYNNILSKKDVFTGFTKTFDELNDAAVALWNFVQGLYNKAKADVKTITHKFCSLDPTGLVCEVLGLRDGNILCAYDLRSGSKVLLFCLNLDIPDMPPMFREIPRIGNMTQPIFSTQVYLDPFPPVPINPAFVHDVVEDVYSSRSEETSPRYTLRDVVAARPGWIDQIASIANALIDTAVETSVRGESPGVDYIVGAMQKHDFSPIDAREKMRDLVRHVGMKPRITQVDYPEMQERVVEIFGIAIAFTALFVGLSTLLLPAFLPCIIAALAAVVLVMIIVLPALAELAGNTMANFASGSLGVWDPFTFILGILKATFLQGFTRTWTPAEIGTLFTTLVPAVSKTLDMCAIYIFKSGGNVFLQPFGNGNGFPSPLYDTNTGEPIDTFLTYINSLLNCKSTDQCYAASDCFNGGCNCVNGTLARGQSRCNELGTCYCAPRLRKGTFSLPQFSIVFKGIQPEVFGYVSHGVMWPIESEWWILPFRWMRSFVYGFAPFLMRVLVYNLHLGSLGIVMPCCACICKCCKRQIGWLTKLAYVGVPLGIGIGLLLEPTVDYCEFRSWLFCRPVKHFFLPRDVQSIEYILALLNFPAWALGAYCVYLLLVITQAFLMVKFIIYLLKLGWMFLKAAFRAPSIYIAARKSHGRRFLR